MLLRRLYIKDQEIFNKTASRMFAAGHLLQGSLAAAQIERHGHCNQAQWANHRSLGT